jgi:hypothetical protein
MGGDFIWQQAIAAKAAGAGAMKIAMFDEVNEATAMFKVVSRRSEAPAQGYWLALDGDGRDLPSDWYLRLSSEITAIEHGTRAPTDAIPIKPGDAWSLAIPEPHAFTGPRLRGSDFGEGLRFQAPGLTGRIVIRDVAGMVVRTLDTVEGKAFWDRRDAAGTRVPAGVYCAAVSGPDGAAAGSAMQSAVFTLTP